MPKTPVPQWLLASRDCNLVRRMPVNRDGFSRDVISESRIALVCAPRDKSDARIAFIVAALPALMRKPLPQRGRR
jgi:hypothetical protein